MNDQDREGFYEKMWKDFVSLQRGDVRLICKDAERYRWLRDIGDETWNPMAKRVPEGAAGVDAAIDAAMTTPNV